MAESTQALAYEQSLRAVTEQRSRLDSLRTRAATLLAAASVVTSFLGAEAFTDTRLAHGMWQPDRSWQCAELVAVGAFIGLALTVIAILWPWPKRFGWKFRLSARALIADYVESNNPASLEEMQRELALHLERHYDANERKLKVLFVLFQVGATLLGVEVVAWLIDLT